MKFGVGIKIIADLPNYIMNPIVGVALVVLSSVLLVKLRNISAERRAIVGEYMLAKAYGGVVLLFLLGLATLILGFR